MDIEAIPLPCGFDGGPGLGPTAFVSCYYLQLYVTASHFPVHEGVYITA